MARHSQNIEQQRPRIIRKQNCPALEVYRVRESVGALSYKGLASELRRLGYRTMNWQGR